MENRVRIVLTALVVGLVLLLAAAGLARAEEPACGDPGTLPELPEASADRWVGSAPLTNTDLEGKVVLLNVWTFG